MLDEAAIRRLAREHYATFESALDVLERMYEEVDTDADCRMEAATR